MQTVQYAGQGNVQTVQCAGQDIRRLGHCAGQGIEVRMAQLCAGQKSVQGKTLLRAS